MLVPGRELLAHAVESGTAAGSFNTYDLEITSAILRAAEARRAGVFLAIGRGAFVNTGFGPLVHGCLQAAREAGVPVAVHLDHGTNTALVEQCVQAGFTSVMIDGSSMPLAENIALTRDAVRAANGVTVEAEIGGIGGLEDSSGANTSGIPMTDPQQAATLARETGIDSLAIAIGNAHGVYSGEPHLDFERLQAIAAAVDVPLVLHGASGIPDADIRRCIDLGVRKINVNTEVRQALFASLQRSLHEDSNSYDVTKLWGAAIDVMQRVVEEKLALFAGA
jgi:fructose-bisphosphate aldolase, class II